MEMFDPPHPGEILKTSIKELGLTIAEAAQALGITRKALSEFLNRHTRISYNMAIRLSEVFGSTPRMWLGLQVQYNAWRIKKSKKKFGLKRLAAN